MESNAGAMLIFAFVCIGAFALILAITPIEFITASGQTPKGYTTSQTLPDKWRAIDISVYNFTAGWNDTLTTTYSAEFQEPELGNRKYEVLATLIPPINDYIRVNHLYGFGHYQHESAKWYNQENELVSFETGWLTIENNIGSQTLDDTYSEYEKLQYRIEFYVEYHYLIVLFDFNATAYSKPSEAWFNNDLHIFIGVTIDQTKTGIDSLNLLFALITFQTLEIFGTTEPWAYALNGIIVLPFIVVGIYIAFLALMEILPF